MDEKNKKETKDFEVRSILISHCGEKLTPEKVDEIAQELSVAMESGPCAWAFR